MLGFVQDVDDDLDLLFQIFDLLLKCCSSIFVKLHIKKSLECFEFIVQLIKQSFIFVDDKIVKSIFKFDFNFDFKKIVFDAGFDGRVTDYGEELLKDFFLSEKLFLRRLVSA